MATTTTTYMYISVTKNASNIHVCRYMYTSAKLVQGTFIVTQHTATTGTHTFVFLFFYLFFLFFKYIYFFY